MNPWQGYPVPAIRVEAPFPDRVVRAFAQRPASVHAMLAQTVRERGSHEALVCEGRRWTYAELDEQACRIAGGLAARGVAAGDRVALFMANRAEFVFVLFAVQRIGAIAVPIGVREVRAGLAFLLNQCAAKAIVFDADLLERLVVVSLLKSHLEREGVRDGLNRELFRPVARGENLQDLGLYRPAFLESRRR